MATEAHIIRSHYDPKDRLQLEFETGQIPITIPEDAEEIWATEAAAAFKRRLLPPPQFVPAKNGTEKAETHEMHPACITDSGSQGVGWYHALERSHPNPPIASTSALPDAHKASHQIPPRKERRNKNNWFILNALNSEQASSTDNTSPPHPKSSLADLLARDPPPLASEERYAPPVWLAIGPSNKGFAMLQRSGWNEGEALGPDVVRHKQPIPRTLFSEVDGKSKGKGKDGEPELKEMTMEVTVGDDDDVVEVRRVSMIDLTESDADEESMVDETAKPGFITHPESFSEPHHRTALVTPIATRLKSDRLGIGLKAKTTGPYKESQRRITHGQAALAAHIRTSEEMKKKRQQFGRGRNGFARQSKKEQDSRRSLLAYLNA